MMAAVIGHSDWNSSRKDCSSVDCHCTVDRDCAAACFNHHSTSGNEVTVFRCNKATLKCQGQTLSSATYEMAVADLGRLRKKKDLPSNLQWYISANDGRTFVIARSRFYEKLAARLRSAGDVVAVTAAMKNRSATNVRRSLLKRLNVEDVTLDERELILGWIESVTGSIGEDDDPPFDDKNVTLSQYLASVIGPRTVPHHHPAAENETIKKVVVGDRQLCNEEMNAGKTVAVYQGRTSEHTTAVCVCTYPEYLTGPACKHRTYHHVIDYDQWERQGYPTFLTDPFADYEAADKVCRNLAVASTAVYDEQARGFLCDTLAGRIGSSLALRGPYEPGIVLDSTILAELPESRSADYYAVNSSYLDILSKLT
uniref:Wsv306-like protein n=1 Tax=Melicertus latisulcatus pemonivirus TaxID=2984278 RepID=A0A9C7BQE0_9VIRU|nr:MAG: wsv306-like protein [Melicertus latisulcatus pemonivirus]